MFLKPEWRQSYVNENASNIGYGFCLYEALWGFQRRLRYLEKAGMRLLAWFWPVGKDGSKKEQNLQGLWNCMRKVERPAVKCFSKVVESIESKVVYSRVEFSQIDTSRRAEIFLAYL
jgi:hypothetical protein